MDGKTFLAVALVLGLACEWLTDWRVFRFFAIAASLLSIAVDLQIIS